jgi:hypothetical protein
MPPLADRLQLLRGEPAAVVAALARTVLPAAEPPEREALAGLVLDRPTDAGLAAVVAVMDVLGPAADRLTDPRLDLCGTLCQVAAAGNDQAVLNAIELARRRRDPRLLRQVAAWVDRPDTEIASAAAAALLEVTLVVGSPGLDAGSAEAELLDEAIGFALDTPNHRLDDVFLAAAVLAPRPGPRLALVLADRDHPAHLSIRRAAGRCDLALVRRNVIRWLGVEAIGPHAARHLGRVRDPRGWTEVLESAHLLLSPARRRALARIESPQRTLPSPATASALAAPHQAWLVRFTAALPLGGRMRRDALLQWTALSSPVARRLAAEALLADRSPESERAVEDLAIDANGGVAWTAARRTLAGPPGMPALRRLEQSPLAPLRRLAAATVAREGVAAFFERWSSIAPDARAAAARAHLAERPREFAEALGQVLAGGSRAEKLRAIALARRLRMPDGPVEAVLARLSAGEDPHVASAAVAALGDGPAPRRVTAARAALGHPDPRVRANAVEALGRIDPDAGDRLGRYVGDPDNRARANAVLALVRRGRPEGEGALRDMLRDAGALHRVSGVWVARRGRVAPAGGELRRVARDDEVPEVRARAAAALRWLEEEPAPFSR